MSKCINCNSHKTAIVETNNGPMVLNHYNENRAPEYRRIRVNFNLCACLECGAVFIPRDELEIINRGISNKALFGE